jgi:superfamily I DNA and/or RNA helicase
VGTIHQFQGSEADVIIFDLVDGPGRPDLGRLLTGDTGIRLINVMITRARGKLILLLNRRWTRDHMKRDQNPLLWDLLTKHAGAFHVFSKAVGEGIEAMT